MEEETPENILNGSSIGIGIGGGDNREDPQRMINRMEQEEDSEDTPEKILLLDYFPSPGKRSRRS